jgi:hypothetical protein
VPALLLLAWQSDALHKAHRSAGQSRFIRSNSKTETSEDRQSNKKEADGQSSTIRRTSKVSECEVTIEEKGPEHLEAMPTPPHIHTHRKKKTALRLAIGGLRAAPNAHLCFRPSSAGLGPARPLHVDRDSADCTV